MSSWQRAGLKPLRVCEESCSSVIHATFVEIKHQTRRGPRHPLLSWHGSSFHTLEMGVLNSVPSIANQDEDGVDCGGQCPNACSNPPLPADFVTNPDGGTPPPPNPASPTTGGVVVKQSGQRCGATAGGLVEKVALGKVLCAMLWVPLFSLLEGVPPYRRRVASHCVQLYHNAASLAPFPRVKFTKPTGAFTTQTVQSVYTSLQQSNPTTRVMSLNEWQYFVQSSIQKYARVYS